jgi:biotin operon repressor
MPVGGSWTFAQIPDVLLFSSLTSNAKVVFAALHKYSTLPKGAIPSHERLSQDLGLSVSTVRRSIDELKGSGFLMVTRRHGTSSMYTLLTGEQGVCSRVNRGSVHG